MRLNKLFLVLGLAAWCSVFGEAKAQTGGASGTAAAAAKPATPTPTAATPTTKAATPGAAASAAATSAPATTPAPAAAPTPTSPSTPSTAPASTAPPSPSPSSTTATQNQPLDGGTYVVRLRDLEQRIDDLKEQIRRSHTRLSLLSDTILSGGVGGARAEITFKNDLSGAFRLTGAVFVLDGVVQYNRQDDTEAGVLATQKEIPIFSGSIPPGDHTLQVVLKLRGHGYGVFSYLRSYRFEVPSGHSFTVGEGKTLALDVIAWEKGDVTTPVEQRPSIRYSESTRSGFTGPSSAPARPAPKSGAQGSVSGSMSVGAGSK